MSKEIDLEIEDIFPAEKELAELAETTQVVDATVFIPGDLPAKQAVVKPALPTVANNATDVELAEKDFKYARDKIINALESSDDVLQTAAGFANGSADAESISAYASVLKGVTESSIKLLELHTKLKSLKKDDANEKGDTNVTNNTVVLTTDEMIKMIKNQTKYK